MVHATHEPREASAYRAHGGPWDQPTLDELLTTAAHRAGERILVVDGALRTCGTDLESKVGTFAWQLQHAGVRAGDVVAWQRHNSLDALVALRACWRIGAVAAPLHHGFGSVEVQQMVTRLRPRVVLDDDAFGSDLLRPAAPKVVEQWTDGAALAAVLFTSGSSGRPKGVLHTQHTLAYKARTMADVHGLTPDDVVLMPAPLAHVSGVLNGVTLPGAVPFTSVVMARWDPNEALDIIEREGVTFMVGPPTYFLSMLQTPGFAPTRVASLRLISCGGAGVTEDFVREASERFSAVVKRTYGSTEAPTVATSTPGDPSTSAARHDGRTIGATELSTGIHGELLIRGPEVCVGYLDVDDTAAAFDAKGWYHSGDLAHIDDSGWITIQGRIADVVIRGGENISASEIEGLLMTHPNIQQAVAVGYPDELMGERVCACVVGSATVSVDELRKWFTHHGIAKYKTPERVIMLDTLPLLASGKPNRAALRRLAATSCEP